MKKKFKFYRQFDTMDCGPSCLGMVASWYGKNYPLDYLRNLCSLSRNGVSLAGIHDAAETIGMRVQSMKMTLEALEAECALPSIIHWEQNHFMVLYQISHTKSGKAIFLVADPATGFRRFTEDDMKRGWLAGSMGVAMALFPTDKFFSTDPPLQRNAFPEILKEYLWPQKKNLVIISVTMLFGMLLSMIVPFLTQSLVDDGIGKKDVGRIVTVLLAQFAFFAGDYIMSFLRSRIVLRTSTDVSIKLTGNFISKILKLPLTFFETKSIGDINQRIDDNSRIEAFATSEAMITFFSAVSFIVYYIVIGIYSIKILVIYTFFSAMSICWMLYYQRRRKVLDYKLFGLLSKSKDSILSIMIGAQALKLSDGGESKRAKWSEIQNQLYETRHESLVTDQLQTGGTSVLSQISGLVVTLIVALSVVGGDLTLGMMMSISYILGQLSSPLAQIVSFVRQLQDVRNSIERSQEVFSQKEEDADSKKILVPDGAPSFKIENVVFRYGSSASNKVLDGISLEIPAAKMTALVGASGSGKTTLLKMLLKFYKPASGGIYLDGEPLGDYSSVSVRSRCNAVLQDSYVFDDTIGGNIVMGRKLDLQLLDKVLYESCLTEYVNGLPHGIDTRIGASGVGLSGGEKQRLMIARALYGNGDCLILDEPTSSLDAATEKNVMDRIQNEMNGRTLIVAAHRLSTIRNADQIIVLDNGKVVEQGSHDDLIFLHRKYFELVRNQL